METVEIPMVGTGYLVDAKVIMVAEDGALLAICPDTVTPDYIAETGLSLASVDEAQSWADSEDRAGAGDPEIIEPPEAATDPHHKQHADVPTDPDTP